MRRCLVLLLFVWCAVATAAEAPRKVLLLGASL
jgi:acyl-CoA thioesterase-1